MRPTPCDLAAWITEAKRTQQPWRKFKPSVFRNHDGKQWQVYFTAERDFTVSNRTLMVEPHIGQESGKVVGLTIRDEALTKLEQDTKGE